MMKGTAGRRWKEPLLGLLVAALFLAALEGGSWIFGRFPYLTDPLVAKVNMGWQATRIHDHLLFWRMAPNLRGERLETNSQGLRGPEIPAKSPQEFRVLSLGESTTAGAQVAYTETYSHLLESAIGTVEGKRLRVINAGEGGYTLVQGYSFLRHRAPTLQPDAVLLYFGYNDFLPVAYRANRDEEPRTQNAGLDDWSLLEQRQRPLSRLANWLLKHSNMTRALRSLLVHQQTEEVVISTLNEQARNPTPRVSEAARRDVLTRIHRLSVERGLHLIVIVPWYREFSEHEPVLRQFAAEAGLTVVDLPALLAEIQDRSPYFFDRVHPTPEGHRLVAERIAAIAAPAWRAFQKTQAAPDAAR